jgi:hypothetical protein
MWDPPTWWRVVLQATKQSTAPFQSRRATDLFRARTTWTCHLANRRGVLSHAQRAGGVFKAAVCSTRDSVLDASLNYGYNGISIESKTRPTDQAAIQPADR